MCDTCSIEEKSVVVMEIFPDWTLLRLSEPHQAYNKWNVVYNGTQVWGWNEDISYSIYHIASIKELEETPIDVLSTSITKSRMDDFSYSLKMEPGFGYMLMKAARKAGWRQDRQAFDAWLYERIATKLHAMEATDEWKTKVGIPNYELTFRDRCIFEALQRNKKC